MQVTNSKYWEKRIANATLKTYNTLEEKNIALLKMYEQANKEIREEIYSLYEKSYAVGLMQSEEYARQHLNQLRMTYQKKIDQLYDDVYHSSKENMKEGYSSVYQNVEQQIGKTSFVLPNDRAMEKVLEKSWRGGNFSGRLWKNKEKLNNTLDGIFLTGISTGSSISEMAAKLSKAMQYGFQDAHRLVRTETMHYLNSAALDGYKDSGVRWVQYYAAEDERTCDTCGKYHGKYYRIDKCPVLPLHPNCRCTILPVVDEKKIAELEAGEYKKNQGSNGNYSNYSFGKRTVFKTGSFEDAREYERWKSVEKKYRQQVKVSKREADYVRHELNNHMSDKQREDFIVTKAIGDYIYTVENYGFDNYKIIGRIKID